MSEAIQRGVIEYNSLAGLDQRFRAPLTKYFRRRVNATSDAEDLTQEVFLRLSRHQQTLSYDNIEALIFTIAANLLRDRGRRQVTRGGPAQSLDDQPALANEPGLVEVLDAERVLLGRDELRQALAALRELGDRTQDVFVLQRLEGMKNKEIARELGISVSAVEKHMVRALTHIAKRLAR